MHNELQVVEYSENETSPVLAAFEAIVSSPGGQLAATATSGHASLLGAIIGGALAGALAGGVPPTLIRAAIGAMDRSTSGRPAMQQRLQLPGGFAAAPEMAAVLAPHSASVKVLRNALSPRVGVQMVDYNALALARAV